MVKQNLIKFIKGLETGTKFLVSALIISVSSFIYVSLATPPTSPYNLGETLEPTCAPGDVNCTVTTPQKGSDYLTDIADITTNQGDLIYYNGSNWVDLASGTSGQFLKTQGAGTNPVWDTPTGSGNVSTSGTPENDDWARFIDGTDIEGLSDNEMKVALSLSNVENTTLSTWTGTGNIITLGTISAGVWNGTAIDQAYLVGQNGINTGDQIISDATISTTDITTNDATTAKHGFLPKLGGGTTNFLRADGLWSAPGSSNLWTESGSNIYFNTGNVSIGTTSTSSPLTIKGSTNDGTTNIIEGINSDNISVFSISTNGNIKLTASQNEDAELYLWADEGDDSQDKWRIRADGAGLQFENTYGERYFSLGYNSAVVVNEVGDVDVDFRVESDTDTHALFVDATNGNVGIGIASPNEKLEVSGNININSGKMFIYPIDKWENPFQVYESIGGDTAVTIQVNGNNENSLNIKNNNNNTVRINGNGNTYLNGGNVGIGTDTPQSTLHIPDGKYAQFQDNNAGAPLSTDCDSDTERGRMSIDTSNNRLYICNGATRGWDYIALTD